MDFNTYHFQNYRSLIRERVKEMRIKDHRFSLRYFAQRIPVQYTYLSKVLNTGKSHLNEDHLHKLGVLLDFNEEELEFMLLLRSRDVTSEHARKEYLTKKIESIVEKRTVSAQYRKMSLEVNNEISYLLNPHAVIVHMALDIEEYRKSPARIGSLLGISNAMLTEILKTLEKNKFIVTGDSCFDIKAVNSQKIHFGREHSLMRTHQALQRTAHEARLISTAEEDKESFNATFTMDSNGLAEAKKLTKKFISDMQKIAANSRSRNVFQLSLSLLKWF